VSQHLRMESLRRPAEDLWRRTLSQIPTVYGRLAYLSSLRNSDTGRYQHHGLAMLFGDDEADAAMRAGHAQCFLEWLRMDLAQQKADLDLHLISLPSGKRTTVENWIRLAPYRGVLPANHSDAERALFFADLEAILELLRREYSVSVPGRADWRRR